MCRRNFKFRRHSPPKDFKEEKVMVINQLLPFLDLSIDILKWVSTCGLILGLTWLIVGITIKSRGMRYTGSTILAVTASFALALARECINARAEEVLMMATVVAALPYIVLVLILLLGNKGRIISKRLGLLLLLMIVGSCAGEGLGRLILFG